MSSRPERKSTVLAEADKRLAALKTISPTLDFGSGNSVPAYEAVIANLRNTLAVYNGDVAKGNSDHKLLNEAEKVASDWNVRMLMLTAGIYGRNSEQYRAAGGTPVDERKKPGKPRQAAVKPPPKA